MNTEEKITLAKENIKNAIRDYGLHTNSTGVFDDISDDFIERLAVDNYVAKSALREMFHKSPACDEKLDALVINGTRTRNPDYNLIADLAEQIFYRARSELSFDENMLLNTAFELFKYPHDDAKEYINALDKIAPKA